MTDPSIDPDAFVASTARVFGKVAVLARAVILFGAVVRAEHDAVTIGEESNLQDNVVVHCDAGYPARIGRRVTVGHAAVVHGATVGDHCLVGIGAMALNGSTLGEGSWLAAGSLLPEGKSVPPWTLALGTPAKPVRELTEEEIRRAAAGVDAYLELGSLYRSLGA